MLARTTRANVRIAGVTIPEDALVFAWLASANRDAEAFLEPERFDVARAPNRHLAFGHGIHFCIGAPLARMEATVALPMILKQLPNLRVAHEKPLELFGSEVLVGLKHLPVQFDPDSSSLFVKREGSCGLSEEQAESFRENTAEPRECLIIEEHSMVPMRDGVQLATFP